LKEVMVNLGPRSYTINIGTGLLDQLADSVRSSGLTGRIALVTDTNVLPLYGEKARQILSDAGFTAGLYEIAAGEESKSLDRVADLCRKLLIDELDRTSGVIALGGGVVGDIAGFVAATYMRGIPYVQVPTTLLAQVDSSIGGKVGVNLPEAKNIVGSFYQPRAVIIDPGTLRTLPEREFRAGLAEVVKYGVIADADLFNLVESGFEAILAQDHDILEKVVGTCCRIKAGVVERDEMERGERAILNYGHTIGHAIEAAGGYDRFLHGEAIAVGMNGAALIAAELGLTDEDFVSRQVRALRSIGLPTGWSDLPVTKVFAALKMDKKKSAGTLRFVLPCKPGRVAIREGVDEGLVNRVLETLRSEAKDNG